MPCLVLLNMFLQWKNDDLCSIVGRNQNNNIDCIWNYKKLSTQLLLLSRYTAVTDDTIEGDDTDVGKGMNDETVDKAGAHKMEGECKLTSVSMLLLLCSSQTFTFMT